MKLLIPIMLFCVVNVNAQSFKERTLKTEINEVTVFLQGAQIYRRGQINLSTGHAT